MTSLTHDIKDKINRLTAFEKIIAVNVFIYIVGWIIWKGFRVQRDHSLDWLALPKDLSEFILKPWTILTYGFAHLDFWHLLFNVLILYFIGRSFSNLFNIKLSLSIYFLGILIGGFLFLSVSTLFPIGIFEKTSGLVGASAGVHAALIFLCTYMPNYEVRFFTFNLKLKHIAIALVIFDVLGLFGNNPGGNVAHIGGDLLGYFYAFQLQKGHDIGKGFGSILDKLINWMSISKKSKLKTVHKRKKSYAGHSKDEFEEFNNQKQIDLILDKISKSGYESLSAEEKEFLFRSGKQ